MKLVNILEARSILTDILDVKFDGITAYKIAKFLQKTEGEAKAYGDGWIAICEKHNGKKTDKGYDIPPEEREAVAKEIAELGETEVEDISIKLKVEDISPANLTPRQIFALMDIIED